MRLTNSYRKASSCPVRTCHLAGYIPSTPTCGTEWPRVGRQLAVAGETLGLLMALAPMETQVPIGTAVTQTAWFHSWCDFGPLLQVQGLPIHLQSPDAAQKAPLSAGCASYKQRIVL
jgi:hypothetical protein